ncbi:hypothetical protein ACF05T_28305 [Streptomyces lateritius]|uniref:Uncharacterized protein n=1 Tax=Streptomyces lateritius TaxID=67313 RepID=A0ABW6YJN4_9ACTN
MITRASIESLIQQTAKYAHPNFQTATRNKYNHVVFTFAPFTGSEPHPHQPVDSYHDESLTPAAREFLREQYEDATSLWKDVRYVNDLKTATTGASAAWTVYTDAIRDMEQQFVGLQTTPNSSWNAAISKLVTAQDHALAAAVQWDEYGRRIANAHEVNLYSDLSRHDALKQAGMDPTGWIVGHTSDYSYSAYNKTPAVRHTTQAIEKQNSHLKKVAGLTTGNGGTR